ncbi:MAG: DNA-binding protein [Candidatus Methanospirareceae archaeon]
MVGDDELEAIRRQKYEQMQKQMQQEQVEAAITEQKREEIEEAKKNIIRQILTSEARERLNTIRMAKPALAEQLEMQLIGLAQAGRIKGMITDAQFKEILRQMMPKKREITIRRI